MALGTLESAHKSFDLYNLPQISSEPETQPQLRHEKSINDEGRTEPTSGRIGQPVSARYWPFVPGQGEEKNYGSPPSISNGHDSSSVPDGVIRWVAWTPDVDVDVGIELGFGCSVFGARGRRRWRSSWILKCEGNGSCNGHCEDIASQNLRSLGVVAGQHREMP